MEAIVLVQSFSDTSLSVIARSEIPRLRFETSSAIPPPCLCEADFSQPKQSREDGDCHASLAMTRGKGLAMTREVTAPVKNTGKTKYNSKRRSRDFKSSEGVTL